jgi:putative transposase
LRFKRPPGFEHLTHQQWRQLLLSRIREVEDAARQARTGKAAVLGVNAILRQRRTSRSTSLHKLGGLNPRVAARDKWRRIERIQSNQAFVQMHADARAHSHHGRLATFPPGTWAAHRFYRAPVAELDLSDPGYAPIPPATAPPFA